MIKEIESSSSEVESEDGESDLVDEEEDEEDGDLQVNADNPSAVRTTKSGSKSRSMTTRQAVLASVMDSSHIALGTKLEISSMNRCSYYSFRLRSSCSIYPRKYEQKEESSERDRACSS